MQAGDTHPNPGPSNKKRGKTVKFPCGVCSRRVQWNSKAIQCDMCSTWFHAKCMGIGWEVFHAYEQHESYSWLCCTCGLPNIGSSYFSGNPINLSNSFESLASLSPSALPSATSSPSKPQRDCGRPTNNLKVVTVNLNSLISDKKRARFATMVDSVNPDIILGTETKLDSDFNTAELSLPNYRVFRKDRNKKGGGVLIAVRDNLTSCELDIQTSCELLWVKIQDAKRKFKSSIFGCFYNPPPSKDSNVEAFTDSVREVKSQHPNSNVYIGGDFNLRDIEWNNTTVRANGEHKTSCNLLLDSMQTHSFEQVVHAPTRGDSTLDLFFTNRPDSVKNVQVIPGISDHNIVECNLEVNIQPNRKTPRKVYKYDQANKDGIERDLKSFHACYFNGHQNHRSVEENYNLIKKHLLAIQENNIPSKKVSGNFSYPWINDPIRKLINQRKSMYTKLRARGLKPRETPRYIEFDKFVNNSIEQGYADYINGLFANPEEPSANKKRFYNFCKAQRKDQFGVPPLKCNGNLISDPKEKADVLNKHLANAFTREDLTNQPDKGESPFPTMQDITITPKGVAKLLTSLNTNKASGPDSISANLLKLVGEGIAPIIASFFQQTLDRGELPSDFKSAYVSPIHKKGQRSDPGNYRPISLTCILCKTIEHIVTKNLMTHLEDNSILSNLQHGFRANRSCETQLLLTIHNFAESLNMQKQLDAVLLDFTKAFDRVAHMRLLHKLQYYGIKGQNLAWITSFLQNRRQRVVLDGSFSDETDVLSGVPQGTVLGPVLFLCFINDIAEKLNSDIRLFADDALLFREVESEDDAAELQRDLNSLQDWAREWQMEFNAKKCYVLHITNKRRVHHHNYTLNGESLEKVHNHAYLGVILDDKLNWNAHVDHICSKATRTLNYIQRNLHSCPAQVREQAYFTYVRPQVEYASSIWNPGTVRNINAVEKVNRRAARFVKNDYARRSSPTAMIKSLKWNTLQDRRKINDLCQMHKIAHNKFNVDFSEILTPYESRTRSHHRAFLNNFQPRVEAYRNSFFPRVTPPWNRLPPDIIDTQDTKALRQQLTSRLNY